MNSDHQLIFENSEKLIFSNELDETIKLYHSKDKIFNYNSILKFFYDIDYEFEIINSYLFDRQKKIFIEKNIQYNIEYSTTTYLYNDLLINFIKKNFYEDNNQDYIKKYIDIIIGIKYGIINDNNNVNIPKKLTYHEFIDAWNNLCILNQMPENLCIILLLFYIIKNILNNGSKVDYCDINYLKFSFNKSIKLLNNYRYLFKLSDISVLSDNLQKMKIFKNSEVYYSFISEKNGFCHICNNKYYISTNFNTFNIKFKELPNNNSLANWFFIKKKYFIDIIELSKLNLHSNITYDSLIELLKIKLDIYDDELSELYNSIKLFKQATNNNNLTKIYEILKYNINVNQDCIKEKLKNSEVYILTFKNNKIYYLNARFKNNNTEYNLIPININEDYNFENAIWLFEKHKNGFKIINKYLSTKYNTTIELIPIIVNINTVLLDLFIYLKNEKNKFSKVDEIPSYKDITFQFNNYLKKTIIFENTKFNDIIIYLKNTFKELNNLNFRLYNENNLIECTKDLFENINKYIEIKLLKLDKSIIKLIINDSFGKFGEIVHNKNKETHDIIYGCYNKYVQDDNMYRNCIIVNNEISLPYIEKLSSTLINDLNITQLNKIMFSLNQDCNEIFLKRKQSKLSDKNYELYDELYKKIFNYRSKIMNLLSINNIKIKLENNQIDNFVEEKNIWIIKHDKYFLLSFNDYLLGSSEHNKIIFTKSSKDNIKENYYWIIIKYDNGLNQEFILYNVKSSKFLTIVNDNPLLCDYTKNKNFIFKIQNNFGRYILSNNNYILTHRLDINHIITNFTDWLNINKNNKAMNTLLNDKSFEKIYENIKTINCNYLIEDYFLNDKINYITNDIYKLQILINTFQEYIIYKNDPNNFKKLIEYLEKYMKDLCTYSKKTGNYHIFKEITEEYENFKNSYFLTLTCSISINEKNIINTNLKKIIQEYIDGNSVFNNYSDKITSNINYYTLSMNIKNILNSFTIKINALFENLIILSNQIISKTKKNNKKITLSKDTVLEKMIDDKILINVKGSCDYYELIDIIKCFIDDVTFINQENINAKFCETLILYGIIYKSWLFFEKYNNPNYRLSLYASIKMKNKLTEQDYYLYQKINKSLIDYEEIKIVSANTNNKNKNINLLFDSIKYLYESFSILDNKKLNNGANEIEHGFFAHLNNQLYDYKIHLKKILNHFNYSNKNLLIDFINRNIQFKNKMIISFENFINNDNINLNLNLQFIFKYVNNVIEILDDIMHQLLKILSALKCPIKDFINIWNDYEHLIILIGKIDKKGGNLVNIATETISTILKCGETEDCTVKIKELYILLLEIYTINKKNELLLNTDLEQTFDTQIKYIYYFEFLIKQLSNKYSKLSGINNCIILNVKLNKIKEIINTIKNKSDISDKIDYEILTTTRIINKLIDYYKEAPTTILHNIKTQYSGFIDIQILNILSEIKNLPHDHILYSYIDSELFIKENIKCILSVFKHKLIDQIDSVIYLDYITNIRTDSENETYIDLNSSHGTTGIKFPIKMKTLFDINDNIIFELSHKDFLKDKYNKGIFLSKQFANEKDFKDYIIINDNNINLKEPTEYYYKLSPLNISFIISQYPHLLFNKVFEYIIYKFIGNNVDYQLWLIKEYEIITNYLDEIQYNIEENNFIDEKCIKKFYSKDSKNNYNRFDLINTKINMVNIIDNILYKKQNFDILDFELIALEDNELKQEIDVKEKIETIFKNSSNHSKDNIQDNIYELIINKMLDFEIKLDTENNELSSHIELD